MHFEVSENQLNQSKIKLWKILDVESSYSNCIYHQGRRNWTGARARAWQSIKLHFEMEFMCRTSDFYFPKGKKKSDIKFL